MATDEQPYLAVLKASYDYDPQPDAEDEIPIKEDQLLLLLERVDDDWWKVKVKTDADDEGPAGLVPAAYVEPATHTHLVKVLYDYEATQATELSIQEDEILQAFGSDGDWLLAQKADGSRAGYVPGNYVEETTEDGGSSAPAAPSISNIVVPPSPPRPAYVDPADRVASNKAQADDIKTWAVSEVNEKGKKKKGTLGIGNGAIFFASESDKTPVQKWQTSDIISAKTDKPKHILIDIGGPSKASLHFHAGSKDTAEAILAKLESSRALSAPSTSSSSSPPPSGEQIERPRSAVPKAVHFDAAEPEIIPARPPEEDAEEEEEEEPEYHAPPAHEEEDVPQDGDPAVVLYDFTADGEDELTVREGETLLVLEREGDEWWKVRNQDGLVGVVPASYLELVGGAAQSAPTANHHDEEEERAARAAAEAAAREAEEREKAERREREEREKAERERKAQAEQRAKAAAAAAEADRRRREEEREKREKAAEDEKRKRQAQKESRRDTERESSESTSSSNSARQNGSSSRRSVDNRGPPQGKVRTWHDRTGQFRVDAAFLGFSNGKLRLHKTNGVVIEVPQEKMSADDLRYVEKLTKQAAASASDDDEPLETRRQSLRLDPERAAAAIRKQPPVKKAPTIDWFEFFLNAGCDIDDCTRYAHSFEKDKMDETVLPDLTESNMRHLGLREGDIIRVKKAIEQRKPKTDDKAEQLRRDEELARQLQAEENAGKRGQAPNLFAAPNGTLKNNTVRRGRPQPTKSQPPATVDLNSIETASDQIVRTTTPQQYASPTSSQTTTPVQAPPRSSSAAANSTSPISGFDDDAWTVRPSSAKPAPPTTQSPTAAQPARTPSAPPAPPAAPSAQPAVAQTQSSPPAPQSTGSSLAKTTESDIFDQLARLSQYKPPSRNATSPPAPAAAPVGPSLVATPPAGYQSGMGMGNSPVPIGQHLQAQQTGMLPPPQAQQQFNNGPRGPFAPVPANQSLLQPLIPTTTGFNSFVPTRPQSTSALPPPQPPQMQPSPQPPSFLSNQPTGFPGVGQMQPLMAQPTGFPTSGPLMSQPTGMPNGFGASPFGNGGIPPVPSMPTNNFSSINTNPTGFNPGFGQSPFGNQHSISPPPQSNNTTDTSPASVFAKMKSGSFGTDDKGQPQGADKYNALRANPMPLTAQPTGWGGYGMGGMPGGYGYQ
ncbi:hypothetical protein K474DRAFT_1655259 [Panus rudis PR-1116 ss-1]|nr:hypothetical protein K474DRAFT_1655259 [Panus rudis PR-1116 ss-1]